jgi:flagellin-specific chaperone FliS
MLYRAANKLIKTLSIARTAMLSGNDNAAILNYNEVASIFLEKKETLDKSEGARDSNSLSKVLAICYNNIACIHARMKEYKKQNLYFERSIQIAEEEIKGNSEEARFKLACRLYN